MTPYEFKVKEVVRVVDGDTFDLVLDVGFHQTHAGRFRLAGWDTPERRKGSEHERERAKVATTCAEAWFAKHAEAGDDVWVTTEHDPDAFGRWLAAPHVGRDSLGESLALLDLATQWPTRWRDIFDV